ncbi:MAG: D-alanine--poly(phosphoribitol) ligase [Acidipila sp.]|nr:D-alanine--poly(phosphoribitol) ligase [Acidipila sp.]
MASTNHPRTLISGFLRSLRARPHHPALELGEQRFTYAQLWERAGRIAHCLNESLDPAAPLVAAFANRSATAYSGILGILATGRGYVPLNPKFPAERTLSMLAASGCKAVILGSECEAAAKAILPGIKEPLLWILPDATYTLSKADFAPHRVITAQDMSSVADPREPQVDRDATAYLLFTSGSTGTPKGVAVSQRNVTAYLDYVAPRYAINPEDRCSQNFDLTFDLSVHDLFACWDAGAALCPFPEQTLVPVSLITEKELTVWFSVPSVAMFASKLSLLEPGAFPSLRLSLFCGEALSARLATAWEQAAPHSIVENIYGPTEATIAISHYRWDAEKSPRECISGIVPIGWIFEGQQCCVVDEKLAPVPVGESGELCLSGSQVTAGYLRDPVRTQQQFVQLSGSGVRWYRTGDLVKKDERGCIYYLGRIDHQVKISGYRVELQEIEQVLREAASTEMAVAVPWPLSDGTASGIVAVIAGADAGQDNRIIKRCAERLPKYMVPTRIYHFAELPLNVSGKIDRPKIVALLADNE